MPSLAFESICHLRLGPGHLVLRIALALVLWPLPELVCTTLSTARQLNIILEVVSEQPDQMTLGTDGQASILMGRDQSYAVLSQSDVARRAGYPKPLSEIWRSQTLVGEFESPPACITVGQCARIAHLGRSFRFQGTRSLGVEIPRR